MTAVMMYAPDYHDLLPPNPDDGNATPGYSWCAGGAGIKEVDEFNPDLLKDPHRTLVAPYLNYSAEIFRCPADRRTGEYDGAALYPASPLIGAKVPAARSVSMNNAIGTIDPCFSSGAGHCGVPNLPVNGPWLTGVHGGNSASKGPWRTYGKTTQMTAPSPAGLWVFIEEDQFSINDPVFAMSAGSPVWIDYPASRHEGAAVVAFADAHAEIHRWVDRTTILNGPASQRSVSTNSADWSWLSTRTSSKLQQP
jgi:prepilin-type processing-associated H-X9-DG protein